MSKYPSPNIKSSNSLKEFLDLELSELLPDQDTMIKNHLNLVAYLEMESPLFVLRKFKHHSNRGSVYSFENHSFTVSDNEPALWVFMETYYQSNLDFLNLIQNQQFPIAFAIKKEEKRGNVWQTKGRKHKDFSANGWKHCHIFQCSPLGESINHKNDLKRRSLRLLSPLNHFPFFSPKKYIMPFDYSENKECIEYVIWWLYNHFYIDTNKSYFKAFVEGQNFIIPIEEPKDIKIEYSIKNKKKDETEVPKKKEASENLSNKVQLTKQTQVMKPQFFEFTSTRLSFRKATIDAMDDNDILIINVIGAQNPDNNGSFKMTKLQIFQTFDNVINSVAYNRDGNYNYQSTPNKVQQFRVVAKPIDGSLNTNVSVEYVKVRLNGIDTEQLQCPKCDLQSHNLNWFEFRTSDASWRHLAGRQGFYARCPACNIEVENIVTKMN
jgi:hypothetical protein